MRTHLRPAASNNRMFRSSERGRSVVLWLMLAMLCGGLAAASDAAGTDEVLLSITDGATLLPSDELVFHQDLDTAAGMVTNRSFDGPTLDSPGGALSVQSGAIGHAEFFRLRARLNAGEAGGSVGLALASIDEVSWLVAGLLPENDGWTVALWRSGIAPATLAADDSWSPAPGTWFRFEIEMAPGDEGRVWKVRAWPDGGDRPGQALIVHVDTEPAQPGLRPAVWVAGAGNKRVEELQFETLSAGGTLLETADGDWPAVDLLDGPLGDDLGALRFEKGLRSSIANTESHDTDTACHGYRYQFDGWAPAHAGSRATLQLPPLDTDCDGLFNEDPYNGRDDDGDGRIDEDDYWASDSVISWVSVDAAVGETTVTHIPAAILMIRRFHPTPRDVMSFVAVEPGEGGISISGAAQARPQGEGRATLTKDGVDVLYRFGDAGQTGLKVTILERGRPLSSGTWFSREVEIDASVSGGKGETTVALEIGGRAYQSGDRFGGEGYFEVRATAEDSTGATATSVRSFGIDTTLPVVAITSPVEGAIVGGDSVSVTGTITEIHIRGVWVNGLAAEVDGTTFTAEMVPLSADSTTIEAVASDFLNQRSTHSVTVLRGTVFPPVVTLSAPVLGRKECLAGGGLHLFDGTVASRSDDSPQVLLDIVTSDGTVSSYEALVGGDGSWSVGGVSLGDGDGVAVATVTAIQSDGLQAAATRSFKVDGSPPIIEMTLDGKPFPGTALGAAPTAGAAPVLFGRTVTARAVVSDGPLGTLQGAVLLLDGAAYTAGSQISTEGEHLLVATVTDCAGHTTSVNVLFEIDLTAPTLASVDPGNGAVLTGGVDEIAGTADSELAAALVNGSAAMISGSSFSVAGFVSREGENRLEITLSDAAGNSAAFERSFIVDSDGPSIEILIGGLPIPTGAVFTETVAPILRSNDTEAELAATLNNSPFTSGALIDGAGSYSLEASATDALGRTASTSASFEIDLSPPPEITITAPLDGAVLIDTPVTVTGTVDGRDPVVTVNGLTAIVNGANWSVADLPVDAYVLNVISAGVRDAAGRSAGATISVMVDTGEPQILILEPEDGFLTNRSRIDVGGVVVGGRARTGDGTVLVAGSATAVSADGAFRALDVPLVSGSTLIDAEVTDDHGRVGRASITVHSDHEPPTVFLFADGEPLADGATFADGITLGIEVTDNSGRPMPPSIRINGDLQGAQSSVAEIPVTEDGGYMVAVAASDAAGNERRVERSFSVSRGGCVFSEIEPPSGSLIGTGTVSIRGGVAGSTSVMVRVPAGGSGAGAYQEYTARVFDETFLAGDVPVPEIGDNELEIVCVDGAGGETSESLLIRRLAEGDGPTITITAPADGLLTSERTVAVSGAISDSDVTVTVNGSNAVVGQAADGSATFSADILLSEGPNVVAATAIDGVGRTGSDRNVVVLDTRAPEIRIVTPENNSWLGPQAGGDAVVDVSGVVNLAREPHLATVTVVGVGGAVDAVVDPGTGVFIARSVALDPTTGPAEAQRIVATAVDSLGQAGTSDIEVHFDSTGPAIVLDAPPDLERYSESSPIEIPITGDAWALEGAQLAINGATLDPLSLEWDGPDASGRLHTRFAGAIERPVADGPFGIVARVTELDGRWAGTRRLLQVDGTAPEVLETYPAHGTTGVDPDSQLLVLFSEPVLPSSLESPDGLVLTRIDTGDPVVGQIAVAGSAVAFVSGARLATETSYRLRLGSDVVDLVGHPLAATEEVNFSTATGVGGGVPVLDPLPEILCQEDLVVRGLTAPNATVRVTDGQFEYSAFADSSGRFGLSLPLTHDGYHMIRAARIDRDGVAGPEATVVIRVDCTVPSVDSVNFEPATATIQLRITEPVDAASATIGFASAAIRVFDDEDPTDSDHQGTVVVSGDGDTITVQLESDAAAWWRETIMRLEVDAPLADLHGNVMAAPYVVRLFPSGGEGLSGGYLLGEVFNDSTGRPLADASVRLFVSGAPLPGTVAPGLESVPLAEATTDARGRYQIIGEVNVGRYTLVFEATGFGRVIRRLDLEPSVGTVVFDARLTPTPAAAGTLDPVAGGRIESPSLEGLALAADPGGVPGTSPVTVYLTARSGQSLPDFLPLGWTPLATAEVAIDDGGGLAPDGEATAFADQAVYLEMPLPDWVTQGDALFGVRYHLAGGSWLTGIDIELIQDLEGHPIARLPLLGPGTVAVIVPDRGSIVPPLPAGGSTAILRGVGRPAELPALVGDLVLDPPVVPAAGRSRALVVARSLDGETAWPSGIAVQAYLEERLVLAGGGEMVEAPFVADLLLYRPQLTAEQLQTNTVDSAGAVEFVVSPSERAASVLIDTGYENIRLFPFPEQLQRGQVLGPAGGSVSSVDGVVLTIPEGALSVRTAVSASLLSEDELAGLPAVVGFDTLAAIRLDLGGEVLSRAATLSLEAPEGTPQSVAGDPRLVLSEAITEAADGRGSYQRLAARVGRRDSDDLTELEAAPEPVDSGLPLVGIVREGLYRLLSAQSPIGYATGFVRGPNEAGLTAARVMAEPLGTADLSAAGGRYSAVVPVAPGAELIAVHPTLDEGGNAALPTLQPGDIVAVDITVRPVPPEINSLSPDPGATGVHFGSVISVTMSEALDPETVASGTLTLALADGDGNPTGAFVQGAVELVSLGREIAFNPSLPLAPGRTFVARFAGGVSDAGGALYGGGPVEWSFTTSADITYGGQVRPERFHIRIPADGVARIYGDPSALPTVAAGETPWAVSPWVNSTVADPVRETFSADSAGAFSGTVGHPPEHPVTIDSEIWVTVFDSQHNIVDEFRLGVFATADGRGFVAPPDRTVSFTTVDDITAEVPAGAFDQATVVTITPRLPADLDLEHPPGMSLGAFINVDFEGEASQTLTLKVPAPADADVGTQVYVGRPMSFPWGDRLKFLSVGGVIEDRGSRYFSNDDSVLPTAKSLAKADSAPDHKARELLEQFRLRGEAAFFYQYGAEWTMVLGVVGAPPANFGAQLSVIYNFLADQMVYVARVDDWDGEFLLPVPVAEPYHIVHRDGSTGWLISEGEYDPVADSGGGMVDIGVVNPAGGDRPELNSAAPFQVIRFRPPEADTSIDLRPEIEIHTSGDTIFLREASGVDLSDSTSIGLFGIAEDGEAVPSLGPDFLCGQNRPWNTPVDKAREMVLVVGPGKLDVATFSTFDITFDRSLAASAAEAPSEEIATLTDLGPIEGCPPPLGDDIPVDVEFSEDRRRLSIRPSISLTSGHYYQLLLDEGELTLVVNDGAEVFAYGGPRTFLFATKKVEGKPIASGVNDVGAVRDLMRFGNLLVLGSTDGRVTAVDTSESGAGNYTVHATMPGGQSSVRAFATDGHDRLFLNARFGSTWGIKTVRVEDIRDAIDDEFTAVEGAVRTAYSPGSQLGNVQEFIAGSTLPWAIPVDLEVVVQDEVGETLELAEFYQTYLETPFDPAVVTADDRGFYDFSIVLSSTYARHLSGETEPSLEEPTLLPEEWRSAPCSFEEKHDRYQRVTVDNLTTGDSRSFDIENPWLDGAAAGTLEVKVKARIGDRLRVRYNLRAIGHLALLGSGITVVDLNRFYRLEMAEGNPGLAQCGRRLGRFEGEDVVFAGCGLPGSHNGIDMTTALAAHGTTGCGETPCRGENSIHVYSPLVSAGAIHSESKDSSPGGLQSSELFCTRDRFDTAVSLRDIALAEEVKWWDWGIRGDDYGRFTEPDDGLPKGPAFVEGDVLFLSAGDAGVMVFDVSDRYLGGELIGQLQDKDHSIHRLHVDPIRKLLFAGGYDYKSTRPVIEVWEIAKINGGPGTGVRPRPLTTVYDVPWVTNHLAVDDSGLNLFYSWNGDDGATAVPFAGPDLHFSGIYRSEVEVEGSDETALRIQKATSRFVPLGVPMEISLEDEKEELLENERDATAAFKLRVALPGSLGPVLSAKIQSLRSLPESSLLNETDLGAAVAVPGGGEDGEVWPETEVVVTLERIVDADGKLDSAYNLYESRETVLILADPRAAEGYLRQGTTDEIASEEGQCRRCEWPEYLAEDEEVLEILAGGKWLRAILWAEEGHPAEAETRSALEFFDDNYPAPAVVVEMAAWADSVPSPLQASLAEPALSAAIWAPGEAGVAVSLVSGEALVSAADYRKQGRALSIALERSYRSGTLGRGPLGSAGWHGSLFAHLREIPTTGEVEYHDGRGNVWRFFPAKERTPSDGDPAGTFWAVAGAYDSTVIGDYAAPKGVYLLLDKLGGAFGWRMQDRGGNWTLFDADGRLAEVNDRFRDAAAEPGTHGNTLRLYYDGYGQLRQVVDDLGREYLFEYNDDPEETSYGLLEKFTDFAGREVEYSYDESGRLEDVELPEIVTTAGGETFVGGNRPSIHYVYPPRDNIDSSDAARGGALHGRFADLRLEGFELPQFGDHPSDTQRATFAYHGTTGRVETVSFPGSGADAATRAIWSIDTGSSAAPPERATVTSPWPHETVYEMTKGRADAISELDVPIFAGGSTITTRNLFTDDGRLEEKFLPDGSWIVLCYADVERAECPDRPDGASVSKYRLALPNVLAAVHLANEADPGTQGSLDGAYNRIVDKASYETGSNLPLSHTDGNNRVRDFAVAAVDATRPGRFVEEGVGANVSFDSFGRVEAIDGLPSDDGPEMDAAPPRTDYTYRNGEGGPESGLLGDIARGEVNHSLDYDDADNVEMVESSWGVNTWAAYDEWDRPIRTISGLKSKISDPSGAAQCIAGPDEPRIVEHNYDASGHLISKRHCQDYVAADGSNQARFVETTYDYNAREQFFRISKSHIAAEEPNAPVIDGPTEVVYLFYRDDGRLDHRVDYGTPDVTTWYHYDTSGRLDGTRVGDGLPQLVEYDAMGRVVHRFDGDESHWFGGFDAWGRLYWEQQPSGAFVRRVFDAADNLTLTEVLSRDPDAGSGGEPPPKRLAASAHSFTSFGSASRTVNLLKITEGTAQVRVTERLFDSSGRTALVRSGPANETGVLEDLRRYTLDTQKARREVEYLYEGLSGRLLEKRHGGSGEYGSGDEEHTKSYQYVNGFGEPNNARWPSRISNFERVPDLENMRETSWTEFIQRDPWGRSTETRSRDNSLLFTTFDRSGGVIRTLTGGGAIESFSRDARGLLLRHVRPDGRGATAYGYDVAGKLRVQSDQTLGEGGWDDLWSTIYAWDDAGRSDQVDYPDGTFENFDYYPDHSLRTYLTRDGITVTFSYDLANRVTLAEPSGTGPETMLPHDGGDSYAYDALSRITFANRGADAATETAHRVQTTDFDLGGRLVAEVVGSRAPLQWAHDTWDRPETVVLPAGLGRDPGAAFTGFERTWDSLDRLTGVGGLGAQDLGADWTWGGAGRLYGTTSRGPLATAVRFGYIDGAGPPLPGSAPDGAVWKLGTMTYGAGDAGPTVEPETTWGSFAFGWRGTQNDPLGGAKIGRQVDDGGLGILQSMGWSWELDTSLRLRTAHAGEGSLKQNDAVGSFESFDYGYRDGDQLKRMGLSSGRSIYFASGESGRITARGPAPFPDEGGGLGPGDSAFAYDGAGRRTLDDRFSYRWDWRGRLYEVTVAVDAGTPYDGHQVRYDYDAVGRLLSRVHLGEDDGGGNQPFIDYRSYLWEGSTLLAEAGYGSNDGTWDDPDTDLFLRWRKTLVPGASGLDDAVQVRVEIKLPADTSSADTTYTYLRDELGTVLALVEESDTADPANPPVVARYLYTPYGEASVVAGETPAAVVYDSIATASSTLGGRFPGGQSSLFQGLWTDPVTGIAYARNRWFDARTASWLSEDPLGAVDSANLYAFVGWGPHAGRDPMGLAGYFFDGTTNEGDNLTKSPTNVQVLSWMYAPDKRAFYARGLGSVEDETTGTYFGKGARKKLDDMFLAFEVQYSAGDTEIDIFGFSRGAALAREFANMIAKKYPKAEIRFMGLFDTVAQFGSPDPFNINFDINLDVPKQVQFTAHAVAKNEYRVLFPLSSIVDGYGAFRLFGIGIFPETCGASEIVDHSGPQFWEKAFEGSHGDIGGGEGRNIDVLKWMVAIARKFDVPVSWSAEEYQRQKKRVTRDGVIEDSRIPGIDKFPFTNFGRSERIVFPGNLEP